MIYFAYFISLNWHDTTDKLIFREIYGDSEVRGDKILFLGQFNPPAETLYISWRRHQMETFSALLARCDGNPPLNGGFPSQRPVTRSFDVFLICARTNDWANSRDAGDLRRHRVHYDVTVMHLIKHGPVQLTEVSFVWNMMPNSCPL